MKIPNEIKNMWMKYSNFSFTISKDGIAESSLRGPLFYNTTALKYLEAEWNGRTKCLDGLFSANPDLYITFTKLTDSFDLFCYCQGNFCYVECKDRNFTSSSDFAQGGVIMEKLKSDTAKEEGYWSNYIYTNTFSDGIGWSWVPSSLDLSPQVLVCKKSSVENKGTKEKLVYFLKPELRYTKIDFKLL